MIKYVISFIVELKGEIMLNFMFLILPGILSQSLLYNPKNGINVIDKLSLSNTIKIMGESAFIILIVNIIGLFIGKKMLGVGETFISGTLNPQLHSLTYLLIISTVSIIIGLGGRLIRENTIIYLSKEKGEKHHEK